MSLRHPVRIWRILIFDVENTCTWHASYAYETWLVHSWDMFHSYMWDDSFICVTRIHMPRSYAGYGCALLLIYMNIWMCVVLTLYECMNVRRSYSIWMYECASLLLYINTYVSFICGIFSYRITSTQIRMNVPQTHIHIECQWPVRPTKWHAWWHFRKLPRGVTFSKTLSKLIAQSSNVSFLWNVTKETFDLWALSFERAFENFIPRGIGCIFWKRSHVCMYVYTYIYLYMYLYIYKYIYMCVYIDMNGRSL